MVFQKLQTWQADNGVSDTELARRVGVHQSAISRAKRGLRVLGMEHQLAIQTITKKVSPADWADFYAETMHLRPKTRASTPKKSLRPSVAAECA